MRVFVLEFLDSDVFSVSAENCVSFLDPLIETWDIDLASFAMEIILSRRLAPGNTHRFEFVEREPDQLLEEEAGLKEFLRDPSLSGNATQDELEFLKKLRFRGNSRPHSIITGNCRTEKGFGCWARNSTLPEMANPSLIGPPPVATPIERAGQRDRRRALPSDLMKEASRRLGIMSLLAAVLWVVAPALDHLASRAIAPPEDTRWTRLDATDVIAAASALLSIALYIYSRRGGKSPGFILDLGLVYMVLTALALGLMSHWGGWPKNMPIFPVISWIGVVVLMFAAIVPNSPMKTLVAGLVAVSMNPLAMLIARARGTLNFGQASDVLVMHYPDYLLVGVAVVISHVVTRLGQQVTKEREMGSYLLGSLLGRGGMGEVYRATHRMLARPAAIKLIRPEMIGGGDGERARIAAKRFWREAEAAANLRSPHTVELYDFGVTADGILYFVMELLEGMDLESLIRNKGPLPAARVIHILRQVCESLEEAHASGLVHRDIKPANIHLGRLGLRQDFVKVLDFGLVKSVADTNPEHSLVTADGLAVGTPAYMPPEAALGETVDGRADLYALGCVAYYLLTGHLIFESANATQMIARHLRDKPVPPSERTELPVPPELERLILACLAKDPDDRPRSAADLGRALGAIPVEPWSEEQATEWWSIHRPT